MATCHGHCPCFESSPAITRPLATEEIPQEPGGAVFGLPVGFVAVGFKVVVVEVDAFTVVFLWPVVGLVTLVVVVALEVGVVPHNLQVCLQFF